MMNPETLAALARNRGFLLALNDAIQQKRGFLTANGFPISSWDTDAAAIDFALRTGGDVQGALARLARWDDVYRFLTRPQPGRPTIGSWEGFFSTPGGTLDYMNRVDGEVRNMIRAIQGSPLLFTAPQSFVTGWNAFTVEWFAFYENNKSFLDRTFANVWDQTAAYEKQVKAWRAQWIKLGGTVNTPPLESADNGLNNPLPSASTVQTTALILGGVVITGLLLLRH